jgi:hypothetical protein
MTQEIPALVLRFNAFITDTWDEVRKSDVDFFDFEPYDDFQTREETDDTIFNGYEYEGHEAIIDQFLVFGQDGTGGGYAIWLKEKGADLLDQPIVQFGSEGENVGIAGNFYEFIWLNCIDDETEKMQSLIPSRKSFALNNAGHLTAYFDEIEYKTSVVLEKANKMNEDFTAMMDQVYETIFGDD